MVKRRTTVRQEINEQHEKMKWEEAKISWATMANLNTNEYVSLEVIEKLCAALDCQPGDLIEYVPGKQK